MIVMNSIENIKIYFPFSPAKYVYFCFSGSIAFLELFLAKILKYFENLKLLLVLCFCYGVCKCIEKLK